MSPLMPPEPPQEGESPIINYLWETYQSINIENYQEFYHDATQFKEEAISRFNLGILRLRERAKAERLYWACCKKFLTLPASKNTYPMNWKT